VRGSFPLGSVMRLEIPIRNDGDQPGDPRLGAWLRVHRGVGAVAPARPGSTDPDRGQLPDHGGRAG
jgi:hypothetical protein